MALNENQPSDTNIKPDVETVQDIRPGIIDNCPVPFPTAFLEMLPKIVSMHARDYDRMETPDGQSLASWAGRQPLDDLTDIELNQYEHVLRLINSYLISAHTFAREIDDYEGDFDYASYILKDVRLAFTDEELMRYSRIVWMQKTVDFGNGLVRDRARVEALTDELRESLAIITATLEEEEKDFVWSEQQMEEDREDARRHAF